jgi:hypothetical protein
MRSLRGASAAVALACTACGGSSSDPNKPPIIDSVAAAETVKSGDILAVTVTAHDDDDDIVTAKVHLVASGIPTRDPTPQNIPGAAKQISIILKLAFAAQAGTSLEYDVIMIDAAGAESAPVKKNITIQ